jgi:hypothetical protein
MSWLAPVEMWTKSRLGYQQLLLIRCYVSGVATFTEVEEKERRHHTRCNVANRASRLFATLVHNGLQLAEVRDYEEQIFNLNTKL